MVVKNKNIFIFNYKELWGRRELELHIYIYIYIERERERERTTIIIKNEIKLQVVAQVK